MKVASLYFSSLKTRSLTNAEPPNSAKEPGAFLAAVHDAPLRHTRGKSVPREVIQGVCRDAGTCAEKAQEL